MSLMIGGMSLARHMVLFVRESALGGNAAERMW